MHRNNPLYESQEISMDMFKEPDYDDDDDDMDDDGMTTCGIKVVTIII